MPVPEFKTPFDQYPPL